MKPLLDPVQLFAPPLTALPQPHLFGTEEYAFQNWGGSSNYWVREEETKH